MLFIFIHLIRGAWIKSKVIDPELESLMWFSGYMIFIRVPIEGFLGHIPNRGQMSHRGTAVGINIISIIPFVGTLLSSLSWRPSQVTVNRIFVPHFLIAFVIILLVFLHIIILHIFSY